MPLAGSLSEELSTLVPDEELYRRPAQHAAGIEHLKFGFKSFAFGMLGGATSIITQTLEGVSQDGAPVSPNFSCYTPNSYNFFL